MAHGRRVAQWDQTAAVLAMLFNTHRDPKKSEPATPATYHPFRPKQQTTQHLGRMTMRQVYELMFRKQPIPTQKTP